jgi:hypothetical protein
MEHDDRIKGVEPYKPKGVTLHNGSDLSDGDGENGNTSSMFNGQAIHFIVAVVTTPA